MKILFVYFSLVIVIFFNCFIHAAEFYVKNANEFKE